MRIALRSIAVLFVAVGCGDDPSSEPADAAPDAMPDAPSCAGVVCNAHATCSTAGGTPTCQCDAGYQDNDTNESCDPACDASTCPANATCSDASGTATCSCDAGYQDNDANGSCEPACDASTCSANATCSDLAGTATCACDAGYQDNDINGSCEPACDASTCSGNATCSDTSGIATCACDAGYQDNDDNGTCTPACDASTCSANATCSDASGTATCACDAGYQDNDTNGSCAPACDASTCSANATCSDLSGTATCACDAGWADADCAVCVRYVDAAANGAGTGLTWADAYPSLQPAIDAARAAVTTSGGAITSCEVWVAQGTYHVYESGETNTISLATGVPVYGGFSGSGTETLRSQRDHASNVTVLDGRDATGTLDVNHVVSATGVAGNAVTTTLDGFMIENGNADGAGSAALGGGLYASYASLTVGNCVFFNNRAGSGGGLYGNSSGIFVHDTAFASNSSTGSGGGVYFSSGWIWVARGKLSQNTSTSTGGALFTHGATLTIEGSTFTRNRSGADGGAVQTQWVTAGSTNRIKTSTFEGNYSAGSGGAISFFAGNPAAGELENLLLYGNYAAGNGGAIYASVSTSLSLASSTVFGNRSAANGAGGFRGAGPAAVITNSILYGNHSFGGGELAGTTQTVTYSVVEADTVITGAGNSNADPGFTEAPRFFDFTTAAGTTNSIVVGDGSKYAVGDVLQFGGIGLDQTVTAVSGNVVTVEPAWIIDLPQYTWVTNWGPGAVSPDVDFTPADGSVCIDAGDGSVAPSTDLLGNARRNVSSVVDTGTGTPTYVDIGAFERQAL